MHKKAKIYENHLDPVMLVFIVLMFLFFLCMSKRYVFSFVCITCIRIFLFSSTVNEQYNAAQYNWKALAECYQMSTHLSWFQSFLSVLSSFHVDQISNQYPPCKSYSLFFIFLVEMLGCWPLLQGSYGRR